MVDSKESSLENAVMSGAIKVAESSEACFVEKEPSMDAEDSDKIES